MRLYVAAATMLVACSLTTNLTSLGGDAGDATFGDVTSDVRGDSPSDGGITDSPSCGHTFCDNFDDHALGTGWDNPPPATVTLSDVAVSPPNALQALVLAGDASLVTASLTKAFSAASRVDVQFDMRTDGPRANDIDIATVTSTSYSVTIYASPAGAHGDVIFVGADGGPSETDLSLLTARYETDANGLPYHHYEILLVLSQPATYTINVDGIPNLSGSLENVSATGLSLRVGISSQSGISSPFIALIDNVIVDTQP